MQTFQARESGISKLPLQTVDKFLTQRTVRKKLQATQQPQAQPKDFCVRPSRNRCTSAKTTQVDAPTRSGSGCSRATVHVMASVNTRLLPYNSSIPLHYSSANGSSTTVPLLTPLEDTRDWPLAAGALRAACDVKARVVSVAGQLPGLNPTRLFLAGLPQIQRVLEQSKEP